MRERLEIILETVEEGSYQEYYSRQASSEKELNRLFRTFRNSPRLLRELQAVLPKLPPKDQKRISTLIKKIIK